MKIVYSLTMNSKTKQLLGLVLACVLVAAVWASSNGIIDGSSQGASPSESSATAVSQDAVSADPSTQVSEDGSYTSRDQVALYIHTYGHLPANYISKTKARAAGWDGDSDDLWNYCPGKSIGGGSFHDSSDLLPDASGRTYTECDIDFAGKSRGAKRIVYSNDGLVYYTDDHYESFTRIF